MRCNATASIALIVLAIPLASIVPRAAAGQASPTPTFTPLFFGGPAGLSGGTATATVTPPAGTASATVTVTVAPTTPPTGAATATQTAGAASPTGSRAATATPVV